MNLLTRLLLTAFMTLGISAAVSAAVDSREFVKADSFQKSGDASWFSGVKVAAFPFDEMIYSWAIKVPEGEGFRIYLRVHFEDQTASPWLYAGFWGSVHPFIPPPDAPIDVDTKLPKRAQPTFDFGKLAYDQLLLTKKATAWEFRIDSEGATPLSAVPALHVITTDNKPTPEIAAKFADPKSSDPIATSKIFDLPLRKQFDSKGVRTPDRCQSAAVSTAMQFFGTAIKLEDVIAWTNDPEYNFPGVWPRTIGAAQQFGFEAYIDRFRDWGEVKKALGENKVILCSITMPITGKYIDPPYDHIGGHIVALNGITDDGRLVITDSYLPKNDEGYQCQWKREDFEQIWIKNKGGVGMVVCPPKEFEPKYMTSALPEYPKGRAPVRAAEKAKEAAAAAAAP
ncbi:hypothetical protein BH09SUM1_BH09SUM1_23480 [soil metagenome]